MPLKQQATTRWDVRLQHLEDWKKQLYHLSLLI